MTHDSSSFIEQLKSQLKSSTFKVFAKENVLVIEMNDSSKSVNSFSRVILEDLDLILKTIYSNASHTKYAGLIFISTKEDCFAAGADISIFETLTTKEAGEQASQELHRIFNYFATSKIPTLAAINGVCLGGGLELALACHYRICTNTKATSLGLPEVQLGILPGGGGTQRLPRLIGIINSLEIILGGKKLDGKKSLKVGLVDDVVPPNLLLEKSVQFLKNKTSRPLRDTISLISPFAKKNPKLLDLFLESNFFGKSFIAYKSSQEIIKKTKRKYPAPLNALKSVYRGSFMPLKQGLALEAKLFGELVVTKESRALVHIFEIMTGAKKNPFSKEGQKEAKEKYFQPLVKGDETVGILGAGLMGSGIATVFADKKIRSVLIDSQPAGLQRGLANIDTYFEEKVKRKSIKTFEKTAAQSFVTPSLQLASLTSSPVVIEAVFEDLKVKGEMLKKVEAINKDIIFASNTSSLPIGEIAKYSSHPENVIGMHFFSPVPKMPLVEIIKTSKTSDTAGALIFDLASKMGKNIIVVNDGPGFYTTRILAFQIAEALLMLSEGAKISGIDKAMEKFGMPVGPITLLDEVGIDVGQHIMDVLKDAFKDRLKVPSEIDAISKENRKGRKNNSGFYTYENGKKGEEDLTIYKHFKNHSANKLTEEDIVDRCLYIFLNEAAHCLDEQIITSEDSGDVGAIFGLGFPPFLGGPFFYAKTIGKNKICEKLEKLAVKFGPRFKPAKFWKS